MAEKQQLNGAYYGPSIPPPPQAYQHPYRRRGCGCCLLSFLLKLLVSAVVIIGVAILIFWLIVHPRKVKFHVTDATLTEFNFNSNNNTLQYNLNLTITVRNPNKKIGIYYDKIEARALYEDQRFDSDFLTPFYQGHKNTSVLHPSFNGQNLVTLSGDDLTQYDQEKASGVYNIDVKLYLKIRFKIGKIKVGKFKPKVKCGLKVPLEGSGGDASGIYTKCDVDT